MNPAARNPRLVAVSISDSPDLRRLGYGQEHLHELMINVARVVLRQGAALAYGGDLRPSGFTESLFLLGRGEHGDLQGWKGRLYSFLAWPHYLPLSAAQEAQLINTCHFVRVTPRDAGFKDVPDDQVSFDNETTPHIAYLKARCLSCMRELMTKGGAASLEGQPTPAISARIILGGNTDRFSGIMPGLFEEYFLAAREKIPIYLLGGFGGAAQVLADSLLNKDRADELDFEYYVQKKWYQNLVQEYEQHPEIEQPAASFRRLNACLDKIRETGTEALRNGLSTHQNIELMRSEDIRRILVLLRSGLGQL